MRKASAGIILFWVLWIALALALGGCDGGVVIVTTTPGPDAPTPTQEVWAGDCLPAGVYPIHQGACPQEPQPADITLLSIPAPERWEFGMPIDYSDGSYWVDLNNGAGFAGVRIEGLELISGYCYVIQLTGASDLIGVPYFEGLVNYAAVARVGKSNSAVVTLPSHSLVRHIDGKDTLTAEQDWFWGLYSNDPQPTVYVEVGIAATWAIAKPGNHVRIDAAYVYRTNDNGNCAGIPGV